MIFLYRIRKSLSTKLSVGILVLVVIGFSMALGFLFQHSRSIVMQEAIERADRILKNNALRVTGFLDEVETATHNMEWLILENQQPDSLLNFTHRMVELNRHFNGCSITMEPNTFPQYGRYFSAYSVRKGDSISTVREAEYEYFEKVWYKLPKSQGKAVWTDPYDDFNAGTLYSDEIIASYCVPLYTSDHHFVGVISTDMSLPWLSATITHERPYKNSYCIMIGKSGQYYVHPDSTKLINQTIFSGIEPDLHPDIITLGHQMTTGKKGYLRVNIDGRDCYVFYQPVPKTDWSIALVCSAYDVFHAYNRFAYIVVPLLIIGLVMILLFCRKIISRHIKPLKQLARQARHITDGHFEDRMPSSKRIDIIGRLQNNFVSMQNKIDKYLSDLRHVSEETVARNEELANANVLAQESTNRKNVFLQDMSHQVRTPLNIIMGFVQVLRDNYQTLSPVEIENITSTMQQNATSVVRMVNMLIAASALENGTTIEKNDEVNCSLMVQNAANIYNQRPPRTTDLIVEINVPDTLRIHTNKDYLTKALHELLFNAKKFAATQGEKEAKVVLKVQCDESLVWFTVEDNGPGISEADRDRIFKTFTKLDDFSEGLGLGLSIARQFARLLDGDIFLDPTYTSGSRFILEVPKR